MYTDKVKEAKSNLESLQDEIKKPEVSGSIPSQNYELITSLCEKLESSLEKLSQQAKDYDDYTLQILPDDVNIPHILNDSYKAGYGGYGTVYETALGGSKVAVKLITNEGDGDAKKDFEKEIKLLRLLRHDNIVAYRGSGVYENEQFVVMEFIKDNFHAYIHQRPTGDGSGLSAFLTWHITEQVANALSFLHDKGFAHGDIKPDNILLDLAPVYPKPKLCDFGFSWRIGKESGGAGHARYGLTEKGPKTFGEAVARDTFSFGLVVLEARTGKRPWDKYETHELSSKGDIQVVTQTESRKHWKVGDVLLGDVFGGDLGKIVVECCSDISSVKNLKSVMELFDRENPYKAIETKGEFFACGFLTNTNIYVVDSVVREETESDSALPTYRAEDLECDVDLKPDMDDYKLMDSKQQADYRRYYKEFRAKAAKKIIDDNPMLALKKIITDREGEDEAQKISLSFIKSTYCRHRATRDVWRGFDEVEKNAILKDKNTVNKLFSTSFGLHVAILTNEQDGKRKFVFTQRSHRPGVATPGAFTCGAVESCSVNDFLQPAQEKDKSAKVSLIKTAARGLAEELGLMLTEDDRNAINLNTTYLKFDNHEWGMCGFIDLADKRVSEQNRLSFQRLNSAFTAGPRDRFEHSKIYGVDFDLKTMVQWIREHHNNMASSGKIVVFKVLQTYFGTSAVTKEFASYMEN